MVSYSNPELLEDHGNRFVCILYFLARGVRDRRFDADKVYGKLEMKGFDDQQQATELIQHLERQRLQRVEYDQSTHMVMLTDEGVQWARKECDKLPYLAYRDLQNSP